MSFFTKNRKKALVQLKLVDENTKEVRQLGFATKLKRRGNQQFLVTSSSVLPQDVQEHVTEIVVDRFRSKSKSWSYKSKQREKLEVKEVVIREQHGLRLLMCTGGNDKEYFGFASSANAMKWERYLSAYVFEEKKIIQLEFENKQGPCKFTYKSMRDFQEEKAKGAPIIYKDRLTDSVDIIGVLSMNADGELYPVLFTEDSLDERRVGRDGLPETSPGQTRKTQSVEKPTSSGNVTEAGPSQNNKEQSGELPTSSGNVAEAVSTQSNNEKSEELRPTNTVDVAEAGPSQSNNKQPEDIQIKVPRTGDNSKKDHTQDSKILKESIKSNTECQANLLGLSDVTSAKTDQIFTNLTVYHDSKQVKVELEKTRNRSEQLQDYSHRIGTRVKECKDIFIDAEREKNPKRLLLIGKPGIGKSLFCQKLIRDWACGELFENEENAKNLNIEFAYLLTFRQLSLLGDKKLNLRELLNCSNLLDEHSNIDDSLFKYLIANPSKVLIILDGYDEYSKQHRKEIAGDFDQKYPNNTETNMSIPALCSKLIKGKILRGCVVVTSSRPGEAEELRKVNFDRHVEIAGFSREQVIEFIEKYLSKTENEEIKNYVVEQIGKNDNLISFCHIPLLSFLLCRCLEWRIMNQSGKTDNLPSTTTDLYDEVVEVFVQNLHANLKYANISEDVMKTKVQDTLGRLADLAGSLLKKSKYIFDEEDMAKLNLSKAEMESLKVSGILHCIPGVRISALKTKDEYSFTHLTLQEYLAALSFVKNEETPKKEQTSGQTYVFMSGVLSKKKDEKSLNHMKKLMQNIEPRNGWDKTNKLLTLECLHEYGDDELAKLTITNLFDKYCGSNGWIGFDGLTGVECRLICYLLYIITLVKEQHTNTPSTQSFNVNTLFIGNSRSLTPSIIDSLCKSLVPHNVSQLELWKCELDDKCVEMICDSPLGNKLTYLNLQVNNITDKGVECICTPLSNDNCLVERLNLGVNDKITDKCR